MGDRGREGVDSKPTDENIIMLTHRQIPSNELESFSSRALFIPPIVPPPVSIDALFPFLIFTPSTGHVRMDPY